ncbi:hypothetical protein ALC53_09672 [Atta colombica]|uniref:Uncharacterized protein n=1 Tax=Atta colombica TaxID=520822 RepID=A0A151I0Z7_9HYME|nr:hypothetical protein ALC53_09672 [Atta colombica]
MLSSTRFSEIRKVRGTLYDPLTNTTDPTTCICTYVYTRRSESYSPDSCLAGLADLGRRLEKAAPRYFQFRAVVSPWLRATKQLAIRLDGTFSTFNSHGKTGSPFRIIQMRCNDHDIQKSCCTLCTLLSPRRGPGITVFPTVRKPFGYIDRKGAQNVSTLQRFARSSYLSSSHFVFNTQYDSNLMPYTCINCTYVANSSQLQLKCYFSHLFLLYLKLTHDLADTFEDNNNSLLKKFDTQLRIYKSVPSICTFTYVSIIETLKFLNNLNINNINKQIVKCLKLINLNNIHLLALCYNEDIKKYEGVEYPIRGTLVILSHDNLEAMLYDMVESFQANFFCKICLIHKNCTNVRCKQEDILLRTSESFPNHIQLEINFDASNTFDYGLQIRAVLHDILENYYMNCKIFAFRHQQVCFLNNCNIFELFLFLKKCNVSITNRKHHIFSYYFEINS